MTAGQFEMWNKNKNITNQMQHQDTWETNQHDELHKCVEFQYVAPLQPKTAETRMASIRQTYRVNPTSRRRERARQVENLNPETN